VVVIIFPFSGTVARSLSVFSDLCSRGVIVLIRDPKPSRRWCEASSFAVSSFVNAMMFVIGAVMRPQFVVDMLDDTLFMTPICEDCDEYLEGVFAPLSWICPWDIFISVVYAAALLAMVSALINLWRAHQQVMKEKLVRKNQRRALRAEQKLAEAKMKRQKLAQQQLEKEKMLRKEMLEAAQKVKRIRSFLVVGDGDVEDVCSCCHMLFGR
jgi:hypothetical protein